DLLWTGLTQNDGPFAVRYPRGSVPEGFDETRVPRVLPVGSWEVLHEGSDVGLLAVGTMVGVAGETRERLERRGISTMVVNCRFVKPLDVGILRRARETCSALMTIEENNLPGGFGDAVLEQLDESGLSVRNVIRAGLPDRFVGHGTRDELLSEVGLTAEQLESRIRESLAG
ncbi:MAG: transketolase C-terminal domain-containing protein, partial [Acidobacteriota bacterium]|nr:transketolase C-terminal domain-containing protein [Acidobacteriota bacterium]